MLSVSRKLHLFTGRVAKAEVADKRVALSLDMRLAALSQLQVDLTRGPDGRLEGTYSLTSRGAKTEGKASGRIKPARPPLPQGFVPPKPGEHPRILFRSCDLPALKQKLETPLGQALFTRMGGETELDAIGMGVKYQLTGRREFAEQARAATVQHMTGKGANYSMRTAWGRLPEQVAIAYDLCYDAWPADFKKEESFGGLYSKHGNLRHEGAYKDIGIRALRAIGVDYSGKCGAPCLFVLVDRIQGGKSKVWTWNLGDEAVVSKVKVVGSTFTLPRGTGVLRGTFIAPAKAQVTAKVHEVSTAVRGGKTASLKVPSIHAQGGDEFFLVATVQDTKTAALEVKVEGSGLAARVTIGQRVVRFANDRIVLGDR